MSEVTLPTTITIRDTQYSFSQLHNEFAQTPDGQCLNEDVRWGRYRWTTDEDGTAVELINKHDWLKLLGGDANNLEHMRHTYGIARWFAKESQEAEQRGEQLHPEAIFDTSDLIVIFGSAIVHDRPEVKHGDITYDHKNDYSYDDEAVTLSQMLGITAETEADDVLRQIVDVTNTKHRNDSKNGRAFNIIEHIGYMRTGLIAWKVGNELSQDQRRLAINLEWLTHNVLLNSIPKLLANADVYPAVRKQLEINKDVITEAFNGISEESFQCYLKQQTPEDPENFRERFEKAKELWTQYTKNLTVDNRLIPVIGR